MGGAVSVEGFASDWRGALGASGGVGRVPFGGKDSATRVTSSCCTGAVTRGGGFVVAASTLKIAAPSATCVATDPATGADRRQPGQRSNSPARSLSFMTRNFARSVEAANP